MKINFEHTPAHTLCTNNGIICMGQPCVHVQIKSTQLGFPSSFLQASSELNVYFGVVQLHLKKAF